MPRNTLVINCDIRETRVALIEEGIIAELQIERASSRGTVGNIVLGRVTRVLPGMQAAFIDVGMERAAFLHVEDLIRPHDFEAYLAGARREDAEDRWEKGAGGKRYGQARTALAEEAVEAAGEEDEDEDDEEAAETESAAAATEEAEESGTDEEPEEDEEAGEAGDDEDEDATAEEEEEEEEAEEEEGENDDAEEDEAFVEAPSAGAEPGTEAEPVAAGRRKRRRRRRRSGRDEQPAAQAQPRPRTEQPAAQAQPRVENTQRNGRADRERSSSQQRPSSETRDRGGRSARGKQRGGRNAARPDRRSKNGLRVSRSVPITEVVKEGDEVVVQISKEPIGTKGARVTSHVSLPGRYVVFLPTVEHIGVSKRIGSPRERARLREVVDTLKPPSGGLIVRLSLIHI